MLKRFQRNISVLGRSDKTFENYSRHVASMAIHFGCLPTELDAEQVQDYLYMLQQRSTTPSQTYFKHTVYGLRFLLKTEGLPYSHLHLPAIKKSKKLQVVLSKQEVWRMLHACTLLKHKVLIALLYGCGLRCNEIVNLKIKNIDFDRAQLHVVQSKGNKDRILPMSHHLMRGLHKYLRSSMVKEFVFDSQVISENDAQATNRYSGRGIQWVVKRVAKNAGIEKDVTPHTLRHSYATHLLEDGMNILQLKELLGHQQIETTMMYLHLCKVDAKNVFSPLDTLFAQCARATK